MVVFNQHNLWLMVDISDLFSFGKVDAEETNWIGSFPSHT